MLDRVKARIIIYVVVTIALTTIALRSLSFYIKDKLK
jgi:hypothetical protein